jgi:very-short-patch-repair endonuclease
MVEVLTREELQGRLGRRGAARALVDVLEVVVPRGAVVPRRAGVRARVTLVPPHDRHLLGPAKLPCLRPARATLDLLRLLPLAEAVVVADAVQHAELVSAGELAREVHEHAGLRGVRQAVRALSLADARAESPPESRLRLRLVLAGLRPVPQHDVHDGTGRWVARVDLAFPEARLAVEYDGRAVHERGNVFARDRQRQNALIAAGWLVLRYTAEDLRWRPDAVVAEIAQALRRAA